jgi:uncharacterized protein YqgC (DUF456 family)
MNFGEEVLVNLTLILMVITLFLSVIPFIPGPATMWAIAVMFAVFDGFHRLTPAGVLVITLLTLLGSTTEVWMPAIGVQSKGMSCSSVVGSVFGSIFGTIFIPVPIVGTMIGAGAGALLIELVHAGELRKAVLAGRSALQLYLIGFAVELVTCIAILGVFIISVTGIR